MTLKMFQEEAEMLALVELQVAEFQREESLEVCQYG